MQDLASALAIALATAFIIARLSRYSRPPCSRDLAILKLAYRARKRWLDRLFLSITSLGSIYFLAPVSLPILWHLMQSSQVANACFLALSLNGACIIANVAKRKVKRLRPALFPTIGEKPRDASFPSAHSAQILAFIVSLLTLLPEAPPTLWPYGLAAAGLVVVMLIAYSRIYLQYHYPSDVVAGLILGTGWLLAVSPLLSFSGIRPG